MDVSCHIPEASSHWKRGELVEHIVRAESKNGYRQEPCVFDKRPLCEQLEEICKSYGLKYDTDRNFRLLTKGPGIDAHVLRSEVEVLALESQSLLGIHHASDIVESRIQALDSAPDGKTSAPLRDLHAAVQTDHWSALEFIEKDGIQALLRSVVFSGCALTDLRWSTAVNLAMACVCEVMTLCQ